VIENRNWHLLIFNEHLKFELFNVGNRMSESFLQKTIDWILYLFNLIIEILASLKMSIVQQSVEKYVKIMD